MSLQCVEQQTANPVCHCQAENFTAPNAALAAAGNISWDDSVRGHSGPVQYSYPNYFFPGSGERDRTQEVSYVSQDSDANPVLANWWNAANAVGLPPVKDPLGGSKQGKSWTTRRSL